MKNTRAYKNESYTEYCDRVAYKYFEQEELTVSMIRALADFDNLNDILGDIDEDMDIEELF